MPETKTISEIPRKRAKRMAPADRRQQITNAAIRTFARLGIDNSGHAQVATEADVATATVFLYLPNRDALIDCVLHAVEAYLVEMVEQATAGRTTASEKLMAIVSAFAEAIDSDTDTVTIFLNWGAAFRGETWPRYVEFQDRILKMLESIVGAGISRGDIREQVNPVWAAHLIMGSANMIAQMKFRDRSADDISNFLAALVRGALMEDQHRRS